MSLLSQSFRGQVEAWAGRHPEVATRREMLLALADLLASTVDAGKTLDAIVRFNGGYNTQFDVGHRVDVVSDSHGPALAMEGGGGELLIVIPFIQRIEGDTRRHGVNLWLETGEVVWLGSF